MLRHKKLLLNPIAGAEVMEKHDLYCEDRYSWNVLSEDRLLRRVFSGHAPLEAMHANGEKVRLNVGSFDAEFRKWSLNILANYLRVAAEQTPAQLIVTHSAPRFWVFDGAQRCEVKLVAEYGHVVENLQRLARLAGELGLRLALENNCTRWDEIPVEEEFDPRRHIGHVRQYFSTYPEEWLQLAHDVNEPAFGLCMDTSHATNFAQRFPLEERHAIYHRFIDLAGDRLWHVHWNDNDMLTKAGRGDPHLNVGKGSVPLDVHQRLWHHPTVGSFLLEHWRGEEALVEELNFIDGLTES